MTNIVLDPSYDNPFFMFPITNYSDAPYTITRNMNMYKALELEECPPLDTPEVVKAQITK